MAEKSKVMWALPMEKVRPSEKPSRIPDDRRNDQISGVGKVYPVLHHVAHTNGRDHSVQNEGHAADDSRGEWN